MKVILLFFVIFSIGSIHAQNEIAKRIDSLILSRYNKGLFNGSVLVQKDGEIIYKRSLGWANIELKDTLEIGDPMRIASITKTFTAVCVLKLVEEGKVNLHEDINTYLPEIEKSGITIHHLLSHTSGICYINGGPHFRKMMKYQRKRGDKRWTNDDVLKYFEEYKPKVRKEVGEEHLYSNISFSILASLIERLSGKPYKEYLDENIFTPLRMNNSYLYLPNDYNDNPEKVLSYRLKGSRLKYTPVYYEYKKNGELKYSDDIYGDKYIISNVEDMQKFNQALVDYKIISKPFVDSMIRPVLLNSGKPHYDNYGYGLYQTTSVDTLFYQHGGNIAAFEALNLFDFEGTQIVLLMNLDFGERYLIYNQILEIFNEKRNKDWFSLKSKRSIKKTDKMKS